MSHNIYEMLNQIETDFTEYEETDLTELECTRIKKEIRNRLHKKRGHRGIAVAACAVIAVSFLAMGPFKGEVRAAVQRVSNGIGALLGLNRSLIPYEQVIGNSIEHDGITLTLESVVLDNNELVVSVLQTHEQTIPDSQMVMTAQVLVNGENPVIGAGGGSGKVDDYSVESVMKYHLGDLDTSGMLDVELVYSGTELGAEGEWKFAFTADGSQLNGDTQRMELNYAYTLPDGAVITLKQFTSNAMGEKIYYTAEGSENNYDMLLRGTDDLGNEIEFFMSNSNKTEGRFDIDNLIGNLDVNVSKLTLKPYAVAFPETSGKLSSDFQPVGEEFTIQLK